MKLKVDGSNVDLRKVDSWRVRQIGQRRIPCTPDGEPLDKGHMMPDGSVVRETSRLNKERSDVKPALRDIVTRPASPKDLLWLEVESFFTTDLHPRQALWAEFRYLASPHDSVVIFFPSGVAAVGKSVEGK